MSGFPAITGKEMVKALGKAGFSVVRARSSNHRLKLSDGRKTTVPVHRKENLGPGLINKILRDADMDRSRFEAPALTLFTLDQYLDAPEPIARVEDSDILRTPARNHS